MRSSWNPLAAVLAAALPLALASAPAQAQPVSFCNTTSVTIPSSGAASVYPTNIAVAAMPTLLTDVDVRLIGMNHTWTEDIDILLVGPQGQNLIIMSDVGGSGDLLGVTLTIDDSAPGPFPTVATNIPTGSYRPTNAGAGDTFPAPAPVPTAATTLTTFNGSNPNGTWSLYIVDDTGGDSGSMTGGWCLDITAGEPSNIDVSPLNLASTQPQDSVVTLPMAIGNTGTGTLNWSIEEQASLPRTRYASSGSPLRLGAPAGAPLAGKELLDPPAPLVQQVVADGSFEAGSPNPFWTEASTNFGTPLCTVALCGTGTGTGPLSGSWWAWFGGIAAFEAGSVSQSVTIPAGAPAELVFWVEQFACSGSAADFLEVTLGGTQLWVTTGADPACGVLGYRQITLDVSAYADGVARPLVFNSVIQGSAVTNFFLDSVSLVGGPCAAALDIPWLSVSPNGGTTAPGASTPVDVTFDATGLAGGTYTGNLCVSSNDPDPGPGNGTDLVIVPVSLTVIEYVPPIIQEIPTLSRAGLAAAAGALLLAGMALMARRRRSAG